MQRVGGSSSRERKREMYSTQICMKLNINGKILIFSLYAKTFHIFLRLIYCNQNKIQALDFSKKKMSTVRHYRVIIDRMETFYKIAHFAKNLNSAGAPNREYLLSITKYFNKFYPKFYRILRFCTEIVRHT